MKHVGEALSSSAPTPMVARWRTRLVTKSALRFVSLTKVAMVPLELGRSHSMKIAESGGNRGSRGQAGAGNTQTSAGKGSWWHGPSEYKSDNHYHLRVTMPSAISYINETYSQLCRRRHIDRALWRLECPKLRDGSGYRGQPTETY